MERRGFRDRPCLHFDFGANLRAASGGRSGEYGLAAPELAAVRASLATGALFEDGDIPMMVRILTRFAEIRGLARETRIVLNGLPRHRSQAEALTGSWPSNGSCPSKPKRPSSRRGSAWIRDGTGRGEPTTIPRSVARRLATFRDRTAPLLDLYRERGVPVRSIAVTAAMSAANMYEELARPETRSSGG